MRSAHGSSLHLRRPDFLTASRISPLLRQAFPERLAEADSPGVLVVRMPQEFGARPVEFLARLNLLEVETDRSARVVLNERTGTVVIGSDVKIAAVAVLHGNLTVQVVTDYLVSQPAPFSPGQTTVTPQVNVEAREEQARQVTIEAGATVEDLIRALMGIGSTPRDIIAIMQSIAAAGALEADLEVI